jgi:hypothetical protein
MEFRLSGITLDVDVKDGQATVLQVARGRGYGHVAQTTRYDHMIPTILTVTSRLDDMDQLQFKSGEAWSCKMHFQPKDPAMQANELLQCAKSKKRDRDRITVLVHDSSAKKQKNPQSDWITIL